MQAAFLFLLILFLIILGILISMLYVVRQQSVAIKKSQRVVFICVCHSVSIKYSSYSTTFASK